MGTKIHGDHQSLILNVNTFALGPNTTLRKTFFIFKKLKLMFTRK